jgi:hypothetical protein
MSSFDFDHDKTFTMKCGAIIGVYKRQMSSDDNEYSLLVVVKDDTVFATGRQNSDECPLEKNPDGSYCGVDNKDGQPRHRVLGFFADSHRDLAQTLDEVSAHLKTWDESDA